MVSPWSTPFATSVHTSYPIEIAAAVGPLNPSLSRSAMYSLSEAPATGAKPTSTPAASSPAATILIMIPPAFLTQRFPRNFPGDGDITAWPDPRAKSATSVGCGTGGERARVAAVGGWVNIPRAATHDGSGSRAANDQAEKRC